MKQVTDGKITEMHLQRKALIYVRQSSARQVEHHAESGRLQYGLAQRAQSLGWRDPVVIDEDMGKSAGYESERSGFQRLVTEVSMGSVGLVLSLEATRLARNNRDWYHLIDLCTIFDTLIADQQTTYDPKDLNDRLLLGVKGTMSEAELNLIKFRMRQGRLSKARRGALHTTLPPGYVLSGDEEVEKSPDMREQQVVELIFTKFHELGSAKQTHLWFVQEKIPVAVNVKRDVNGKKRRWKLPTYSFVLQFLRNPFYAGAYSYGRRGVRVRYEEGVIKKTGGHHKPRKEWEVLIRDHHAGYISWERYEDNLRIMAGNVNKAKTGERMGAIRKGKGLLAGLLRCGRCGRKMRVRYWGKKGTTPRYLCDGEFYHGGSYCQSFSAMKTDRVFEAELLALLEPAAVRASVEASATLVEESRDKLAALDRQLEQARYEAQRAELQYQQVDPLNRLVASELERRWNEKLEEAQALDNRLGEERESVRQPTKEEMQEVQALSERLPQVWRHPGIDPAIKKRIIRMLVKEVVPVLDEETNVITMMIHWQGGVHSKVEFKKPLRGESSTKTKEDVVELVRALSPHHSDEDIARILNCKKCKTGKGNAWNRIRVRSLRSKLRIAPFDRNKNREVLSLNEAARQLGVSPNTVRTLIGKGLIGATQVVKFAPFQIERSELEKKEVKEAMRILKKRGSLRSMGIVSKEQMSFVQ